MAYFAKAPVPGEVKTRLCPPLTTDEAAGLYSAFLRRCVQPVPGAKTFVFGWPGDDPGGQLRAALPQLAELDLELRPQTGADLFARMARCFAELFAAGHFPVVLRNTDSPDLEMELVTDAIAASAEGRVVLGPDCGGGYYLVALSAPCAELFTDLDEGVATVFEATCARARALGLDVHLLPERPDVDTFDDLLAMWQRRLRAEDQ